MGAGESLQCKSLKKFKIDLENPSSWTGRINSVALAVASKATCRCKQPLSRFQSNPFIDAYHKSLSCSWNRGLSFYNLGSRSFISVLLFDSLSSKPSPPSPIWSFSFSSVPYLEAESSESSGGLDSLDHNKRKGVDWCSKHFTTASRPVPGFVSLQPHLLFLLVFLIVLSTFPFSQFLKGPTRCWSLPARWGILLLALFIAACSQPHAFSMEPLVKCPSPPALDSLVWLHILKTFLRLNFIYLFGTILVAKLKDPWDSDFSLSYLLLLCLLHRIWYTIDDKLVDS